MADILGLKSYTSSTAAQFLVAAFGNDMYTLSGIPVFSGQQRNLSGNKVDMDIYLDYLIAANGQNQNQVYNGVSWFTGGARTKMPVSYYVKTVGSKMYLADLVYVGSQFRSRVWYPSLPKNNDIVWGFETGTNLVQTALSRVITSANSGFITYGIKTGDPFFIVNGVNAGEYTVDTVDSETQITLTEEMKLSATGSTFWVGSNWFDARTSDGDILKGLGENDNKLLVFKRESLHKYDERELRRVKGVPGTTSNRSIVNVRENTFYFHDSGIYRYDGVTSFIISRPIQDWIEGISSSSYDDVVAWRDGDIVYFFVGDVTNSDRNISLTNCILIFDTSAQSWNIGSLNTVVTCATESVESDSRKVYLGNSSGQVLLWNSGNADISEPIPFAAATVFHFPAQPFNVVEYDRCEVHTQYGRGISVYYKLYGTNKVDENWNPLGDINDDVTELVFPRGTYGRGIAYKFMENSTNKPLIVSRIDTFYKDRESRNLPNNTYQ